MAKRSGRFSRTIWGGYDISGQVNSARVASVANTPEVSTQGNVMKSYVVGVGDGEAEVRGFLSEDANQAHDRFSARIGSAAVLVEMFGTHVKAAVGMGSSMILTAYDGDTPVDGAGMFRAAFKNSDDGYVDFGWLLAPLAQRSSVTASVNDGAATLNGLRAYLEQTAGSGNPAVVVEGSDDDSTYAALGTFLGGNGHIGAALAVAGSIPQYLRGSVSQGTSTFLLAYRRLSA
jgi:hypothetical protein